MIQQAIFFAIRPALNRFGFLKVLLILLFPAAAVGQSPAGVKGWADLRNTNLEQTNISLGGEWELYWAKLIDNSRQVPTQPDVYSALPQLWNSVTVKGATLPAQGFATYRLRILMPKHAVAAAALLVPDFYTAYRLYANGRLIAHDGKVGTSAATSLPHWSTQVVQLPAGADTVELLLQVCNFVHAKGGCMKLIQLGTYDRLTQRHQQYLAQDIFLAGCLFMGAIFFLGLFIFGRTEKAILYFALFCLMYSYRIVGTETYALHTIFPGLDFTLTLRLEYISLCLSVSFFILYVRNLYPEEGKTVISTVLLFISTAYAIVAFFTSPLVFTAVINYFIILLLLYIAYAIIIFSKAWYNSRPGAKYGAWSGGVIVVLFLFSIASYFGILPMYKITELIGYIAFFFLQSLILAYRSSYKLHIAREAAEKGLKAKTQFLSTMSHEIRTPLNAVIGIAQLLQKDNSNLNAQQKEYIDALDFSGNSLLAIVNDILDYGKIDASKLSLEKVPMNLQEIAHRVTAGFKKAAADKQIALLLEVDAAVPPFVAGDPTRTSQVLYNLMSNAIKFTKSGYVKLILQCEPGDKAGTCTIHFLVQDTGIGISAEKLQLIFEPFTQADTSTSRSYGGTGLGLAICKSILELQGIALKVESEKGRGSVFSFRQLFETAGPQQTVINTHSTVAAGLQPFTNTTVLLVEDNTMNVMIAKRMLEKWGIEADIAANGKEAVEKFDSRKHRLVLMDLHMPVMDGYEAARHIRSISSTVPVIALTANVAVEVAAEVEESGMNGMLTKPFKQQELQELLEQHLRPAMHG